MAVDPPQCWRHYTALDTSEVVPIFSEAHRSSEAPPLSTSSPPHLQGMSLFPIPEQLRDTLPAQARAFDFLQGAWLIHHRRLRARLVASIEWDEFQTPFVMECMLGGLGNLDQCRRMPPAPFYEGVSLRLFDIAAGHWKIYWVDSSTGQLCPPVTGTFHGALGTFTGTDTHAGQPVQVRFLWDKTDPARPTWQQAFSPDDGASWEVNWHMAFTRVAATGGAYPRSC